MRAGKFLTLFLLIFSWVFSGWPQIWQNPPFPPEVQKVQAATTGAKYPTLGESVAEDPWLDANCGWVTSTNIYADDGSTAYVHHASFDAGDQSYVLKATGFDFSVIPDGSTINGVTVRVNAYYISGEGAGSMDLCQLLNTSKAKVGTNNCLTPVALTTTTTTIITKGSASDLWGNALTAAWVKSANFGVAIGMISTAPNTDADVDYVTIEIDYTPPIAPTVTTQAASSIEATTATCNGNITATGGANATTRGCEWDTDTGAPYTNSASDAGSFGTGAFTKDLTGLPAGTTIYARAFATNSGGTGYGNEVSFLTKPAAPTGVAATDGTYTDKVTITWTKSTGATDYHVWRDSTDLGAAGDVATFDDTGADAPTITAGSTIASDGTIMAHVALSLSGASANNGTTHTYKVVASSATGNSADSATNTGYRGVGSLTYQWQKSAADSDANYSDISGATATSYNDTGAPSDGSGRYYKVIENATGATQQISTADRGYRLVPVISITITANDTVGYGFLLAGTSKSTIQLGTTPIAKNTGNVAENFNIKGQNSACPWILTAAAGTDQYAHEFSTNGGTNWTALTTSDQTLVTEIAADGTQNVDLRVTLPTLTGCYNQQSVDVTITAVQP